MAEASGYFSRAAHVFAQGSRRVHFRGNLAHAVTDGFFRGRETFVGLEGLERALVNVEDFSFKGIPVQTHAGLFHGQFAQTLRSQRAAPAAFPSKHHSLQRCREAYHYFAARSSGPDDSRVATGHGPLPLEWVSV